MGGLDESSSEGYNQRMSSRRLSLLCAALGIAATIGRANSGEAALGDLFCDSNRDSNAGELANLGGLAERMAARGATTAIDRIAIGKLTDIVRSGQLLRGERRLLSQLPKLESAEGLSLIHI